MLREPAFTAVVHLIIKANTKESSICDSSTKGEAAEDVSIEEVVDDAELSKDDEPLPIPFHIFHPLFQIRLWGIGILLLLLPLLLLLLLTSCRGCDFITIFYRSGRWPRFNLEQADTCGAQLSLLQELRKL